MTRSTNRRRAADARLTLSLFTVESDGLDVAMIDQLTNLMHLAALHGLDWQDLASVAELHFLREQEEK